MIFPATQPCGQREALKPSAAPKHHHNSVLSHSLRARVRSLFLEHDLEIPHEDHLEAIVTSAVQAQQLFYAIALEHPDHAKLTAFFDYFVAQAAGLIDS